MIIFVNRYFYPDHSATSQILTDLVKNISDDYQVKVVTSRLNYNDGTIKYPQNEVVFGADVHRVWTTSYGRAFLPGRAIDYLSFYITVFFYLLRNLSSEDVVVAKTDPPLISIIVAIAAKLTGAKHVNWLQDLFPEVAKGLGMNSFKFKALYPILTKARNWSLRFAEKNVAIGHLMADLVNVQTNQPEKTIIIPNWTVGNQIAPVPSVENTLRKKWGLSKHFVVGYSGNLGRAHDYQTILDTIHSYQNDSKVRFLFIGGGAGMDALKLEAGKLGLDNILFKPYQPIERLGESLSVADVHLVSLDPAMEGLIVPSKLYGILAVARPIIFIGSRSGEFSKLLAEHDCGYIVQQGGIEEMRNAISELQTESTYLNKCRCSSVLYNNKYRHGVSVNAWNDLLARF